MKFKFICLEDPELIPLHQHFGITDPDQVYEAELTQENSTGWMHATEIKNVTTGEVHNLSDLPDHLSYWAFIVENDNPSETHVRVE